MHDLDAAVGYWRRPMALRGSFQSGDFGVRLCPCALTPAIDRVGPRQMEGLLLLTGAPVMALPPIDRMGMTE